MSECAACSSAARSAKQQQAAGRAHLRGGEHRREVDMAVAAESLDLPFRQCVGCVQRRQLLGARQSLHRRRLDDDSHRRRRLW
jgi:hypothetical protein